MALMVRGRRGSAPLRREEWTFHDLRGAHATFPSKLPIYVDFGPHLRAVAEVWSIQYRECDVALARRRPDCRGDMTDTAFARAPAVDERIVGGFVAFDVEPHELTGQSAALLREQSAAAVEVSFLEIDQPLESELEC